MTEPARVLITRTPDGANGWEVAGPGADQLAGTLCLACAGPFPADDPPGAKWMIGWYGRTRLYVHIECLSLFRAKAFPVPANPAAP